MGVQNTRTSPPVWSLNLEQIDLGLTLPREAVFRPSRFLLIKDQLLASLLLIKGPEVYSRYSPFVGRPKAFLRKFSHLSLSGYFLPSDIGPTGHRSNLRLCESMPSHTGLWNLRLRDICLYDSVRLIWSPQHVASQLFAPPFPASVPFPEHFALNRPRVVGCFNRLGRGQIQEG